MIDVVEMRLNQLVTATEQAKAGFAEALRLAGVRGEMLVAAIDALGAIACGEGTATQMAARANAALDRLTMLEREALRS